mgnify:CR=1 FL=1
MKKLFIQFYLLLFVCFLVMTMLVGLVYKFTAERAGRQSLDDLMKSSLYLMRSELREIPPHEWAKTLKELDLNLSFDLRIEPMKDFDLAPRAMQRLSDGDIVALEQVPDEAFASKAVGDGVAVKPTDKIVVAPAAGTIVKIFNTNHAFCLETDKGAEIVVHMGIDTVALNGQGFTRLVEEGAEVVAGQPILEMDLDFLNANARSMISPVVCSNIDDFSGLVIQAKGQVVAGQTPLYEIKGK